MTSIVVNVTSVRRATSQRATPFLSGVVLLWSFRSLGSSAAVLKQLLDLQLTQLRTSRTRAACSCRHRISRYQIKKPKTANFIGIKYNSQSIFTSLSHSNQENNTTSHPGQQVFQAEGEKKFGGKQPIMTEGKWELAGIARCANFDIPNPQKRGVFTNGSLGVCTKLAARARCLICQALFIHRLWVTTGVWEFVGFCQVNQRSGRPGDWTTP